MSNDYTPSSDTRVDIKGLPAKIQELEKLNQELYDLIDSLDKDYKTIDESKWKSKGKSRIDAKLGTYLEKNTRVVRNNLDSCTNFLTKVLNRYSETSELIESDNRKVESMESIQ